MTEETAQPKRDNGSIVTPTFRLAFPRVFEPTKNRNNLANFKPKYEITMLFPKTEDLSTLKKLLGEAAKRKWGEKLNDPNFRKQLRNPMRDADAEGKTIEGYPGHIFIKASNANRIPVVDQGKLPVTNAALVYGGMFCRAYINAYAYDNVSKGVAFGLQALQLVRNGTPFVGLADPDKVFTALEAPEEGAENPANYENPTDPFGA